MFCSGDLGLDGKYFSSVALIKFLFANDKELTDDGDALNRGFCLDFVQQPCSTTSGKWFGLIFLS